MDRPAGRCRAGHGQQDRGQEDDGRGGCPGARGTRPRDRHRRPTAGADQGVGGRRWPRHAGGSRPGRPAEGGRGRPPRGAVRVRRPDGVLRAVSGDRAPRRGAGDGRRPRHRMGRRRTRVFDSASPPEDHRGGPVAARRPHPRHAGQAVRRGAAGRGGDRLYGCGHGRVHGLLRSPRCVLLPGDEHPAAGRAPRHRGDHRPGPGRTAAAGGRRWAIGRRASACAWVFDRSSALCRRSRQGLAAAGRTHPPLRGAYGHSRIRADRPGRGARRLRHRRRIDGVGVLRPDAGQGHLPCFDPGAGRLDPGRRPGPHPPARHPHQPRPVGERAAASSLPRRRHRHRVLRDPRAGRAGITAGRSCGAGTVGRGRRPRRCRREPLVGNGSRWSAERLAQPGVGVSDQALRR